MNLLVTLAAIAIFAIAGRSVIDPIVEALNHFRGGGPPSPMHPLPSGDAGLLKKKLAAFIRADRR